MLKAKSSHAAQPCNRIGCATCKPRGPPTQSTVTARSPQLPSVCGESTSCAQRLARSPTSRERQLRDVPTANRVTAPHPFQSLGDTRRLRQYSPTSAPRLTSPHLHRRGNWLHLRAGTHHMFAPALYLCPRARCARSAGGRSYRACARCHWLAASSSVVPSANPAPPLQSNSATRAPAAGLPDSEACIQRTRLGGTGSVWVRR